MLYSKARIDLVNEARRRVPSEDKPAIKLANPDVLKELHVIYNNSKDHVLKAVIKELFAQAGDPWTHILEKKEEVVRDGYIVKSYRGVTQLVDAGPSRETDRAKSRQRIYRGRLIAE